jgi:G3E family GTPase
MQVKRLICSIIYSATEQGCICCTVRGDLVRTLNSLVPRRKDFHAILLETTGLADPAPIIQTFSSDATIQDNFRIDAIVCLVDSKNVTSHLREVKADDAVNEAVQQVAFADRIVLNKLDLVNAEELAALKEEIASINHTATLIETTRSVVDLSKILNQSAFR